MVGYVAKYRDNYRESEELCCSVSHIAERKCDLLVHPSWLPQKSQIRKSGAISNDQWGNCEVGR